MGCVIWLLLTITLYVAAAATSAAGPTVLLLRLRNGLQFMFGTLPAQCMLQVLDEKVLTKKQRKAEKEGLLLQVAAQGSAPDAVPDRRKVCTPLSEPGDNLRCACCTCSRHDALHWMHLGCANAQHAHSSSRAYVHLLPASDPARIHTAASSLL